MQFVLAEAGEEIKGGKEGGEGEISAKNFPSLAINLQICRLQCLLIYAQLARRLKRTCCLHWRRDIATIHTHTHIHISTATSIDTSIILPHSSKLFRHFVCFLCVWLLCATFSTSWPRPPNSLLSFSPLLTPALPTPCLLPQPLPLWLVKAFKPMPMPTPCWFYARLSR